MKVRLVIALLTATVSACTWVHVLRFYLLLAYMQRAQVVTLASFASIMIEGSLVNTHYRASLSLGCRGKQQNLSLP